MIIQCNPDVRCTTYRSGEKHGFMITAGEEDNYHALITSSPSYNSAEQAQTSGTELMTAIKEGKYE